MKPLKLSIQAFGPFAAKEEIDFTVLGESPLFLINGPTGAGKSSILDAICFALYGETTSKEREASQMRCDQASAKTSTEVTLEFSLAGKLYRVKRAPQQERPKARGEGTTIDNGFATLWQVLDNDELKLIVPKKVKEVTQEIENITGLNVEQFRQVMVLPQGKFRELLLADSKQREKIFGQLFQTQIYKRIEDELKQQASTIYNEVRNLDNQIKGILQTVEVNTEAEIEKQLQSLKPALKKAVKHKDKAQQSLHEVLRHKEVAVALLKQFEGLETTRHKISELASQQADIDTKQQRLDKSIKAEKIKPLFVELTRLNTEHEVVNTELTKNIQSQQLARKAFLAAETNLKLSQESFKDVEPLKHKQQLLLQYEKKIIKLDEAKSVFSIAENNSLNSQKILINTQQELDRNSQEIENIELQLIAIQKEISGLGDKQVQLAELSRKSESRQKLEIMFVDLKSTSSQLQLTREKFEAEALVAELSQQHAKQQEMLWHSGQAINLARELKQDQPCPVCGSRDHPSPALPDGHSQVVSKQQVDLSRSQAEKDKTRQLEIEKKVNVLELELKQLDKHVVELKQDLAHLAESSVEQVQLSFNSLQSEVGALLNQQCGMAKINDRLVACKSSAVVLKLSFTDAQLKYDQLKNQAVQDQTMVRHLINEIPQQFLDHLHLTDELKQIQKLITMLSGKLDSANVQLEETKTQLTQNDTTHTDLLKRETLLKEKLDISKTSWSNSLEESVFTNEGEFHHLLLSEIDQLTLSDSITQFTDQMKGLKGALKQQQKELGKQQQPDLDVHNLACLQMEQNYQRAEEEWHELDSTAKPLKSAWELLKNAHEKNAELEARYAVYGTLSDVANGRTYNKLSLQRFVLSVLLDDVLIQASQRLSLMSKGRYQMLRKDARSKGNKASGLELEVEDAYTGKTRSVATLSGGESFMAALALALGLSDVVQAYAGGIKLDTLFIDEGFGSLDQESLDLAIRTLIDLQASGRMIGIISHVTELKEQMTLRLDVISTKVGSHINIITA